MLRIRRLRLIMPAGWRGDSRLLAHQIAHQVATRTDAMPVTSGSAVEVRLSLGAGEAIDGGLIAEAIHAALWKGNR